MLIEPSTNLNPGMAALPTTIAARFVDPSALQQFLPAGLNVSRRTIY
jgi:hypothetical protein